MTSKKIISTTEAINAQVRWCVKRWKMPVTNRHRSDHVLDGVMFRMFRFGKETGRAIGATVDSGGLAYHPEDAWPGWDTEILVLLPLEAKTEVDFRRLLQLMVENRHHWISETDDRVWDLGNGFRPATPLDKMVRRVLEAIDQRLPKDRGRAERVAGE